MIKKIIRFCQETMSFNHSLSLCTVKKRNYNPKTKEALFEFDTIGLPYSLRMKAQDIVKNKVLFNRFSYEDKSQILFDSGACSYHLVDMTLSEDGREWLISIQASFEGADFIKKYTLKEILNHAIFNCLSQANQRSITKLMNDSNLIDLSFYRHRR